MSRLRRLVSTRRGAAELFWHVGAPTAVIALLFAFGAHF